MLKILIVEDQDYQIELLKRILLELGREIHFFSAKNEEHALEISKKENIHIFFVDIFLENSSGIEFGENIRKISKYKDSWIIYVTSNKDMILRAVNDIHCYGYITKPYKKEEIFNLMEEIIIEKEKNDALERDFLWVDLGNLNTKIYEDEIIFIESISRKIIIHTYDDRYNVKNETLNSIEDKIKSEFIIKSHKSYLINVNYIEKIIKLSSKVYEVKFINYDNDSQISYKYKDSVFEKMRGYGDG